MDIPVRGKTEEERRAFADGYLTGMRQAAWILKEVAREADEVAGACPAGPYTNSANLIEARLPRGEIVTTHVLR